MQPEEGGSSKILIDAVLTNQLQFISIFFLGGVLTDDSGFMTKTRVVSGR